MLSNYLLLMRYKQYTKNLFVFFPLFFSLKFFEKEYIFKTISVFCVFCLVSSIVYIINDLIDFQNDKKHPIKCFRPIAIGKISIKNAIIFAFILLFFDVYILQKLNNMSVVLIILSYLLLNIFYSLILKKIVIIDVLSIAAGFVLRIYAGSFVINVYPSNFIILTTLFLTLLLGFSKRKLELQLYGNQARKVLSKYSMDLLDDYIYLVSGLTIVSYLFFTMENKYLKSDFLIYSSLFVIYGIFRYLYIVQQQNYNIDDPIEILFKDKILFSVCGLYIVYMLLIYSIICL